MEIIPAQVHHLDSYQLFLAECFEYGILKYGPALKNPKCYLAKVIADAHSVQVDDNTLQTSTYLCLQGNEVIGAIRFRHQTNDLITRVIGHVGYETKPSARGKGVAKFMLNWMQKHVLTDDIIITCEVDNHASKYIIHIFRIE
jgi:predicted acetyltransferase